MSNRAATSLLLALLVSGFVVSIHAGEDPLVSDPAEAKEQLRSALTTGTCLAGKQSIDMRDILWIQNTSIRFPKAEGYSVIEIQKDSLVVKTFNASGSLVHTVPHDLPREIGEREKRSVDLDVQLKFVLLDNKIALYWRETFLHRVYRQGLFRLDGERLEWWCEGVAGARRIQ